MWSGHSSCPLEVCDVGGWRSWDPSEALSCGWCYVCVGRTVGFVLPWGREGVRGGRSEKLSEDRSGQSTLQAKSSLCNGTAVRSCISLRNGMVGTQEAWEEEER